MGGQLDGCISDKKKKVLTFFTKRPRKVNSLIYETYLLDEVASIFPSHSGDI